MGRTIALGMLLVAAAGSFAADDVKVPETLTFLPKEKGAKLSLGYNKGWLGVFRIGEKKPLLVSNTPEDGRPYLHPIVAPDGKGIMTEYAPGHHKHQTGLYVGFLKVNGRDFFHNLGKDYYTRTGGLKGEDTASHFGVEGNTARWSTGPTLLDKDGKALLRTASFWTFRDEKTHYLLDLEWTAFAYKDVTFGKHDYGGLFLRMPWKQKTGGKAVNSEGDENAKAEGKKAMWVDVGMPIEGRKDKDWGHIAILDHKDNPRHPVTWRVDGQLGVGPAPSRAGDWKIEKGKSVTLRYRLVVYTGDVNKDLIEKAWKEFAASKK